MAPEEEPRLGKSGPRVSPLAMWPRAQESLSVTVGGSAILLGPPGMWFLQWSLVPGTSRGVSLSLGPSGLPSPLVSPAGHLS